MSNINSSIFQLFIELLQVAVGNRDTLSVSPTDQQWLQLHELSKQQALIGICYYAVKKLPDNQRPEHSLLRIWSVQTLKISTKNADVSKHCRILTQRLNKSGFDTIILKGQGNISYYPEGLKLFRQSGDIDVWMWPHDTSPKGNADKVKRVIEYCQSIRKGEFVYYHNMDFPVFKNIPVEVHYRPSWLFCPWRNKTLQRWFDTQRTMATPCNGTEYEGYLIPGTEFNIVFQMLHIYKHIFEEGIGLRQLLDYYCLLISWSDEDRNSSSDEINTLFGKLGLNSFAGAVMYVLHEVFGLNDEKMICPSIEKEGRVLLSEIMIGGNFGHYDERYQFDEVTNDSLEFRGFGYAWMRLKRNFRFVLSYPMEVLFEPPFRIVNWSWRTFRLWRF